MTRIDGLDLARFLALIAMMCTHVWVIGADGSEPLLASMLSGKAASLFAVLAGVGLALTSRRHLAERNYAAASLNLLGRGAVLILIGLTIGLVSTGPLVILPAYGLMFWLVIPFLALPPRMLIPIAIAWGLIFTVVTRLATTALGGVPYPYSPSWLEFAEPAELLRSLFIDGAYPVLVWLTYPLVGLALGKLLLTARAKGPDALRRLGLTTAGVGTAIALAVFGIARLITYTIAAPGLSEDLGITAEEAVERLESARRYAADAENGWFLFATGGHSGSPVDIAITSGTALATISVCLVVGLYFTERVRRWLRPVLGAGGAPLTVYVTHLLLAVPSFLSLELGNHYFAPRWWEQSGWLWLIHILVALGIGALLRLINQRGPLELLVSFAGQRVAALGAKSPK
ncbi:DUF1624 domain-containing protein [Gulosibacter macacae]|uniref:DUF1624 domain-containing protein n=1 Tax=Gulosibacter macacae TaxID=2488791 RepID=A0A3P3W432_9MICO|nr:heparan-alpha-glucosaminide N-acetyltransferase domain-containing protein [Gulosibacter macacae]RRJ88676.1 DUF1624 domain-containing protein [Gulosibacter macacae]